MQVTLGNRVFAVNSFVVIYSLFDLFLSPFISLVFLSVWVTRLSKSNVFNMVFSTNFLFYERNNFIHLAISTPCADLFTEMEVRSIKRVIEQIRLFRRTCVFSSFVIQGVVFAYPTINETDIEEKRRTTLSFSDLTLCPYYGRRLRYDSTVTFVSRYKIFESPFRRTHENSQRSE